MKRGTDHKWIVVKYKADTALYARCKCGFEYNCGRIMRLDDEVLSSEQYQEIIYPYCPWCGARKKRYNDVPKRLDRFRYE